MYSLVMRSIRPARSLSDTLTGLVYRYSVRATETIPSDSACDKAGNK